MKITAGLTACRWMAMTVVLVFSNSVFAQANDFGSILRGIRDAALH